MRVRDKITGNILENNLDFIIGAWLDNPERFEIMGDKPEYMPPEPDGESEMTRRGRPAKQ